MSNLMFAAVGLLLIVPIVCYSFNRKVFYYSLLVVYPLVGQSISTQVDVLGMTFNPSMLFGLLVLFFTALDFFLLPTNHRNIEVAIVVFIAYTIAASVFSPVRMESLSWSLKIATWLMILAVSTKLFNNKRDLINLYLVVSIGVIVVILSFVLSKLGYYGNTITYETGVTLYGGGFQSGKSMAYYLAIAMPVLAIVGLDKNQVVRPFAWFLAATSMAVIVLTFVRSPILALLIGFMVCLYFRAKYCDGDYRRMILILVTTAIVVVAVFYFLEDSEYTSRWREIGERYHSGKIEKLGSGRIGGLVGFYEYYVHRAPILRKLFGSGLGASHVYLGTGVLIHNDFAEIILGCGVVGISIYILILIRIFKSLRGLLLNPLLKNYHFTVILALSSFFMLLAFHMTNISSGVFILSVWSMHVGTTIGVGYGMAEKSEASIEVS